MRTLEQALETAEELRHKYEGMEIALVEEILVLANEVFRLNAVLDRIEKTIKHYSNGEVYGSRCKTILD